MARRMRHMARAAATQASSLKNKISISWRSFLVFFVLFLISLLLFFISESDFFIELFELLSIILGFLSLALFIVLVVFLILKSGRR